MKKTSTRLAAIGGIIVLGAFAIALAQHDARKRDREQPQIEPLAAQPAVPIPMENAQGDWEQSHSLATKPVVRGNNDQLPSYGEENYLPESGEQFRLPSLEDDGQVVTASGGVPIDPPAGKLPSTNSPPSWLGGGNASAPAAELPSLPTFPIGPSAQSSQTAQGSVTSTVVDSPKSPLPSMASPMPAPPTTVSQGTGDMSDTQRGVMQPTNLMQALPQGPVPQSTTAPPSSSNPQSPGNPPQYGGLSPGPSEGSSAQLPSAGSFQLPTTGTEPPASSGTPRLPTAANGMTQPAATAPYAAGSPFPPTASGPSANSTRPPAAPAWPAGPAATSNARPGVPATLSGLVSNQPGNRYLDGSQNPIMLIQKRAPEEIQVGKKATFVIAVRNAGNAVAHDVSVVDSVPQGARFVESVPAATPNAQGILAWNLGEMAAGEDRTITLQIIPEVQGEVGSVASVHFAAQASVRTVATLPKIELELEGPPDVLVGSLHQVVVTIRNTGTGMARNVRLEADLPETLQHRSGEAQLVADLGDMPPNHVQRIPLDATAISAGKSVFDFRITSDDGISAEDRMQIEVRAPKLTAAISGPKIRYLERQATYTVKVVNVGTSPASNVDFVVNLPAGLKYNSANNRGEYNPAQHSITWGVYELPVGEQAAAVMEFTVLPVDLGPQAISFAASGELGATAEAKAQVTVEGQAELEFVIGQDNGTIEVGTSSTYAVQITNVGDKADKNVQLAVQLPGGSTLLGVDAQVKYRTEGNQIIFEPIADLRTRDQYTYRFTVQHNQAGFQIVRAQMVSANWPQAVIKEEGTRVYNDQN